MKNDPLAPLDTQKMEEDIKTNHVGGLIELKDYAGSDINLSGWELTSVVDDVLLVEYADGTEKEVVRGGIVLPTGMSQHVWRIGKVLLAGAKCTVEKDEFVMFPNDKGLKAKNVNGKTEVVFLNQDRIFGVVRKTKS